MSPREHEHLREIHLQALLLDAVDAAVIATDLDGVVTHWNQGAQRLYGWSPEEAVGHPVVELTVLERDRAVPRCTLAGVRPTGYWEGELELRRRDGSTFPAHVRNALYSGLDGEPAGVVGVSVDISQHVEAQRGLRAARDYMRAVTDSMGEGLFTLDTAGRLIYLNRAGEEMLGWANEELSGRFMHEVVGTGEGALRRRDGSELPAEMISSDFETEDGVRGRVVVFRDVTERRERERRLEEQLETVTWARRLRDALADDRLVLHAQPIVEVRTGAVAAHELLVRMVDDDGGLVPPGSFLPAAEECGLVLELDRWVVSRAAELAADGHPVHVNLSAHSVGAPGVADHFHAEARRVGADPSLIVVELTETALLRQGPATGAFFERLKATGCRLALDDFGTGYGGFSHLKRLPVDFLKIDIEFVADLVDDEGSRQVVRAVVGLARGFNRRTVAEGVENEATLALLGELDVDLAQGFGIARPGPVAEVLGKG
ncbi:MAG: EAL domain-containing protein [Actinomycetota bacterium]|nr:EAL domain-containing protein [Actinomycetota bacterium]